jgi:amino acid adenylation domain-containing protein/non-ribosomal peptide synthase protein (TIGR01720 family)
MNLYKTITDTFAAVVDESQNRIAVETDSKSHTYADLNTAANRIANVLIERSGFDAKPVLLFLHQGVKSVAAILAVIKAGQIYVPLDPEMSLPQLRNIVEDCSPSLALCSNSTAGVARAVLSAGSNIINVEELSDDYFDDKPGITRDPLSPIYIFYTSGSTGRPKGVVDCHRNVIHNVMRYTKSLKITQDDRLSMVQSPDFSGTVSSMFAALLNGATLLPYDLRRHGLNSLDAWICRQKVTIFHSVPSIFRHLRMPAGSYRHVRIVRLEGDGANLSDIEHYRERFEPRCCLVNGLGATECGIVRQYFIDHNTKIPFNSVPIGHPVIDMDVRIVNDEGEDVECGKVGEIVVRSKFLALGYWNRPDLTHKKFRPHPDDPDLRDYHSGDLGRMHADGCIEYVGRSDFQTKIRGQRVDTAIVERALRNMEEIRDAVIQVWNDSHDEPRLVAYLVPQRIALPHIGELRKRLGRNFAAHQIPTFFLVLDDIPLTPNGKLDRRKLSEPNRDRLNLMFPFVSAKTDQEKNLTKIWQQAFSLDTIGVLDNFLELGGDSLTAATIVWLAEEAGMHLSLQQLHDHPTIRELAGSKATIRNGTNVDAIKGAFVPLTSSQARYFGRDSPDPHHWNISAHFVSVTAIEPDLLKLALAVVMRAHDALRLRFKKSAMGYRQEVEAATEEFINAETASAYVNFQFSDLQSPDIENIILSKSQELQESLDLNKGPMLRLAHFQFFDRHGDHFVLISHHVIMDPFSLQTVLRDLGRVYEKLKNGEMISPSNLGYSYQIFCNRLKSLANTQTTINAAEQWSKMNWRDVTDLPRDYPQTTNDNCNAAACVISLECNVIGTLQIAHDAGYTTHELLLTALHDAVSTWTGSNVMLVDILRHGRQLLPYNVNPSSAVGMFLYYMPIVLETNATDSLHKLKSIIGQLRNYWSNGWVFETVQFMTDNDAAKTSLEYYPRAEILFNYQGRVARPSDKGLFRRVDSDHGNTHSPRGRRDHPLNVRASLNQNVLDVRFIYSRKIHRRETILKLAHDFRARLFELLDLNVR